jgi:hypothetical protein
MLKYGMIADERVKYAPYRQYRPRRGLFARLFQARRESKPSRPKPARRRDDSQPEVNGTARLDAELDRILKKVHERGLHSLSYVERQTLERATRERQRREREFQQKT